MLEEGRLAGSRSAGLVLRSVKLLAESFELGHLIRKPLAVGDQKVLGVTLLGQDLAKSLPRDEVFGGIEERFEVREIFDKVQGQNVVIGAE
jgi:hypothetical protein